MPSYRTIGEFLQRLALNRATRTFVNGTEQAGPSDPKLLHDLLREEGLGVDLPVHDLRDRSIIEALLLLAEGSIPAEQVDVEQSNPAIGAPDDLETVLGFIAGGGGGGLGDVEFSRDGPYSSNGYLKTGGDAVSSEVGYAVPTAGFITDIAIEFRSSESATVFVENESFVTIASVTVVAASEKLETGLAVAVPAGDEIRVKVRNDGAGNLSSTFVTVKFGNP